MSGPFGPLPGRAALGRRPRHRWRTVVRRQPVAFWALALTAALAVAWGTQLAVDATSRGAAAYGDLIEVAVVSRDVAAGEPVAGATHVAMLPAALVPGDALASVPEGSTARVRLVAGEAVAGSRLAPAGAIGLAAQLDVVERAIAVPTDGPRAPMRVGQRVDVLATTDPSLAGRDGPTSVVARSARVLAVDDDGVTVAVDESAARAVATALATAVVTVVVAPG